MDFDVIPVVRELSAEHDVVALSRRPTNLALSQGIAAADHVVVRGDFSSRDWAKAFWTLNPRTEATAPPAPTLKKRLRVVVMRTSGEKL